MALLSRSLILCVYAKHICSPFFILRVASKYAVRVLTLSLQFPEVAECPAKAAPVRLYDAHPPRIFIGSDASAVFAAFALSYVACNFFISKSTTRGWCSCTVG